MPVRRLPLVSGPTRVLEPHKLAVGLTVLLAVVLLAVVIRSLWMIIDVKGATDLLGVVLAPLVGLVGAATGFCYGGKER
jgi:hypothetical protein